MDTRGISANGANRYRTAHATRTVLSTLADLMTYHAAEGAFEDWARRQLLGGDEHAEVGVLFGEIHRAVRARREERNRVFAAGVSEWPTGARGRGIVSIEHFLTRVVAPLGRLRPVLVLVLDGMDAGIFEELGESMYGHGWLRHRGAAPEAVLAVLPTITESSRMALLTGGVKRGNAAAEKVGFARHPELRDASRAGRPPRLFHKGELTDGAAQGLAVPVREALGSERQRIAGIVLNAVDDHLAKSEQIQLTWRVDSVRLPSAILNEAHAAGRAVILTSDHGHNQGRLSLTLLAQRLNTHVTVIRSTIADLQRILNVDGYPVLRLDDRTHTIELDSTLFVKLFDPRNTP